MCSSAVCCLLVVVCSAIGHVACGPIVPTVVVTVLAPKNQTDGCVELLVEGKGDFRIEKKRYGTQTPGYFIQSLVLKERKSFYKCTPAAVKYGIATDDRTWWVDKGCEGVFEVSECPQTKTSHSAGNKSGLDQTRL